MKSEIVEKRCGVPAAIRAAGLCVFPLACFWLVVGCVVQVPPLAGWEDDTGGADTETVATTDTEDGGCDPADDRDADGVCDALDGCPYDPAKTAAQLCGCGVAEPDWDSDSDTACGAAQVDPSCLDLAGTDWGEGCTIAPLGVGVVDGDCEMIYGCAIPAGLALYPTKPRCIQSCTGCASNDDCVAAEYCRFYEESRCGEFALGECVVRPEVCIAIYDPVCGCDGEVHSSACNAGIAGVTVKYAGDCADNCNDDDDTDGVCDDRDGCPDDPAKTAPGLCGCGVAETDTDSDQTADCISPATIEDFEQPGIWPWSPWVQTNTDSAEWVAVGVAHDGNRCLEFPTGHTYDPTVNFPFMLMQDVISAWCMPGVTDERDCAIGFGATADEAYRLVIDASDDALQLEHVVVQGMSETRTELRGISVPLDAGRWYRLEVHSLATGKYELRVYDADGVTLLGSFGYEIGALPGTGISTWGRGSGRIDTIEGYLIIDGGCTDMDGDGSCDVDDLCLGNDAFGDPDGDGRCADVDLCWGEDILGDSEPDGFCDTYKCPAEMPAFYDQTQANHGWAAGGVCAESLGVTGPPACTQDEWLDYVMVIEGVLDDYPWTGVVFEESPSGGGQFFAESPYTILCSLPPEQGAELGVENLFDDLNACYRGAVDWNFGHQWAIIDFTWGVNIPRALEAYGARAAQFGGECQPDTGFSSDGRYAGFHATFESASAYWTILATDLCNFYGCGCDATLTGWSDADGVFTEDAVVNDSNLSGDTDSASGIQPCLDPRFDF